MYPDYNMHNSFYGFDEYNYRGFNNQTNTYSDELITLNQAIELIRQSVGNEREDEVFYDNLIKQAPAEEEKELIQSIRDDEKKHNKILRDLYYNFTGQMVPPNMVTTPDVNTNQSYKENLKKALFGELDAVKKYRRILGTMPSGNSYTLLMAIMTDELGHASKYNYLIHKAG